MKKLSLIVLGLLFCLSAKSQIVKLSEAEDLKKTRLLIARTGNEEIDAFLKQALQERWTLYSVEGFVNFQEGKEKVKNEEGFSMISISMKTSESMQHKFNANTDYVNVSQSVDLCLWNGGKRPVYSQPIPYSAEFAVTEEFVHFGVSALHDMLQTMVDRQLKNNMKVMKVWDEEAQNLKDLTLLVPEIMLHKKLEVEEAEDIYDGNIVFTSYENWKNSILEQASEKAYIMQVPTAIAGNTYFNQYIMNAESGKVMGVVQPKAPLSISGPGKSINLSKNNNGSLTKSLMKKIAKVKNS